MNKQNGMSNTLEELPEWAKILGYTKLTKLERPWVCERCGYVREYKETKQHHIDWHERRIAMNKQQKVKTE